DKATKKFSSYLRFPEVFPKFVSDTGNTAGLICIAFDPGYAKNGKFYTVHIEKPDMPGSAEPSNAQQATLKLEGYTVTPAINPPDHSGHSVAPPRHDECKRTLSDSFHRFGSESLHFCTRSPAGNLCIRFPQSAPAFLGCEDQYPDRE